MSIKLACLAVALAVFGCNRVDPKVTEAEAALELMTKDVQAQAPQLAASMAELRTNTALLQNESRQYQRDIDGVKAKIEAARFEHRDDIAEIYSKQLASLQEILAKSGASQAKVEAAQAKGEKIVADYKATITRKIEVVLAVLPEEKKALWKPRIDATMALFDARH